MECTCERTPCVRVISLPSGKFVPSMVRSIYVPTGKTKRNDELIFGEKTIVASEK